MLLEWSTRLELGVDPLDRDHRQIIAMMNLTLDALKLGDLAIARGIAAELVAKVRSHFTDEEAMVAAADYPHLDSYRTNNATALQRLEAVEQEIMARAAAPGDLVAELERIADIFSQRLAEDLALKPYLATAGNG